MYGGAVFLSWLVINNAADWIIGSNPFSTFFYTLLLGVTAMYLLIYLSKEFKKTIVSRMDLEGKQAFTELGWNMGKVNGLTRRKDAFLVQTTSGQKLEVEFDNIKTIGENGVVVSY